MAFLELITCPSLRASHQDRFGHQAQLYYFVVALGTLIPTMNDSIEETSQPALQQIRSFFTTSRCFPLFL